VSAAGRAAAAKLGDDERDALLLVGAGRVTRADLAARTSPDTLRGLSSLLYHSTTTDEVTLTSWGQEVFNGLHWLREERVQQDQEPVLRDLDAIGRALADVDRKRGIIMDNLSVTARAAKAAGVPILTIAERAGVTRQTIYDRLAHDDA
jgi:hypothetical protein